jgi:hypothetical protein
LAKDPSYFFAPVRRVVERAGDAKNVLKCRFVLIETANSLKRIQIVQQQPGLVGQSVHREGTTMHGV